MLNAIEAVQHFKIDSSTVLVRFGENAVENNQINALLKRESWDQLIKIFPKKLNGDFVEELKWIAKFKNQEHFDFIFFGDYRANNYRYFIQNVSHDHLVMLDDGTAAYYIQESYIATGKMYQNGRFVDTIRNFIARYLLRLQKPKPIVPDLFTALHIEPVNSNQQIIRNSYSHVRKGADKKAQGDFILLVGAKYSEAGWMSEQDYMSTLSKIRQVHSDSRIQYVPHRGEHEAKLSRIKSSLDFDIVRFETILEISLLNLPELPLKIIGFTSTALITLSRIFPDIEIESIYLPESIFEQEWRTIAMGFYEKFRVKEKLRIIEL